MSLQGAFSSAATGDLSLAPSQLSPIPQSQRLQIPIYECIKGFPSNHPDAALNEFMPAPQPYNYGVNIEFEAGKGAEFVKDANFRMNHHTITNTINEMMGEALAMEMLRDISALNLHDGEMSEKDFDNLMKDIHENTWDDAKIALQDLPAVLQETFPDSGIIGAEIGYMRGENLTCSTPSSPYASAPSSIDDLTSGLSGGSVATAALKL